MRIEITSPVKVLSDITRAGESNRICAAIVTAVYPNMTGGNIDTAGGAVLVDVTAFPNGRPPICVQQLFVYDQRTQGGNIEADNRGFAFVIDDLDGNIAAQAVPMVPAHRHVGAPA